MLNCKTKTNVTISVYVFVREREREREHLHLGVELADAAANEEEVRCVLSLGFCMMRFGEIRCGFFILWFWVFSQGNGAKAQTLTNGSDINSGFSPFKDPSPISAVASPVG